jgi:hypothetical protein
MDAARARPSVGGGRKSRRGARGPALHAYLRIICALAQIQPKTSVNGLKASRPATDRRFGQRAGSVGPPFRPVRTAAFRATKRQGEPYYRRHANPGRRTSRVIRLDRQNCLQKRSRANASARLAALSNERSAENDSTAAATYARHLTVASKT